MIRKACMLGVLTLAITRLAEGAAGYSNSLLYPVLPAGFVFQTETGSSGNQTVGYTDVNNAGKYGAILWSGPSGNPINITPGSFGNTFGLATNGSQQVGNAFITSTAVSTFETAVSMITSVSGLASSTAPASHAILWSGTAASAVDLAPTNLVALVNSVAYGISNNGSQQVGYGSGVTPGNHALLWTGSAGSAIDLSPSNLTGFLDSTAYATDGIHQVGSGDGTGTGGNAHALLWSGAANTAVDLNPTLLTGITSSTAKGVSGNQEVGFGSGTGTNGANHAFLWLGTADSAIDLNPTNLGTVTSSQAIATNGSKQVGSDGHALVWSGSAASAVDLQLLLPAAGTWTSSSATNIDAVGNIFGIATGTFNGVTGPFAVEWSPVSAVPEPGSILLVVLGAAALLTCRRR